MLKIENIQPLDENITTTSLDKIPIDISSQRG